MVDTFKEIKTWFELAIPKPTEDHKRVQLGVHIEEITEMFDEFLLKAPENILIDYPALTEQLTTVANRLKQDKSVEVSITNRTEFLDSLCDQVVTAIGVAHMNGFDILGALAEVSASNSSKFVDGKPIFNEHGKIAKGKNYFKPDLTKFI